MAEQEDNPIFTNEEQQTLTSIERGLQAVDYSDNGVLEALTEVIAIFEEIRSKVITQLGPEDFATMEIEIDLTQQTPEARLYYTTEAKNSVLRSINRLRKKPENTQVLILTKTGYRTETLQTIDTHRFKAGTAKQLREAPYSRSSYSTIYGFIEKIRDRLKLQ